MRQFSYRQFNPSLGFELLGRAAIALLLLLALPAASQVYPAKPVHIIVAQVPGGASDLLIRSIAQKLADSLGQQLIIDNRPGAGGNIGAEIAARAAPDGGQTAVA